MATHPEQQESLKSGVVTEYGLTTVDWCVREGTENGEQMLHRVGIGEPLRLVGVVKLR